MKRKPGARVLGCHFGCDTDVNGSLFRTPVEGVPGVSWIVCSPGCSGRPDGVVVFEQVKWWERKAQR